MDFENISLEQEQGVMLLTINRPKQLNALNHATLDELDAAINAVAEDSAIRVLLITGAGDRAFVAGADIREFEAFTTAQEGTRFALRAHDLFQKLQNTPKPIIAAINGFALGGGLELALACDIRLAADSAILGLPEVTLGLMPGWGGTTRLVRLVGPGLAKLLVFSGERLSADQALSAGIVERIYPAADLLNEARALAARIAGMPPLSLAAAKNSLNRSHDMSLGDANQFEAHLFGQLAVTEDAREGARAFLEKRAATWTGR
jgi:enoyl-CoA hydratase